MGKIRYFLRLWLVMTAMVCGADQDLDALYRSHNVKGALIITSLNNHVQYVHNPVRASTRFIPASTFKIPNTLIALEENIFEPVKDIFKWDGKKRVIPAWNKNQTLSSAFNVSCVWCYQQLAEKIGNERYLTYLKKLNYGNQKTGTDVTTFWLHGDLAISPREQVKFLRKFYLGQLPFKRQHMETLKKIMLAEENAQYSMWAKSGLSQNIGWFTGFLKADGKVWFFANNMDVNAKGEIALRKQLVLDAMKIKNII